MSFYKHNIVTSITGKDYKNTIDGKNEFGLIAIYKIAGVLLITCLFDIYKSSVIASINSSGLADFL
jgi:hypothetical protein